MFCLQNAAESSPVRWTARIAAVASCCLPTDVAGRTPDTTASDLQRLSTQTGTVAFRYDLDALQAELTFDLSRLILRMRVTNPLELPEVEFLPAADWYEDVALSQEVSGFEVDVGNERVIGLEFVLYW